MPRQSTILAVMMGRARAKKKSSGKTMDYEQYHQQISCTLSGFQIVVKFRGLRLLSSSCPPSHRLDMLQLSLSKHCRMLDMPLIDCIICTSAVRLVEVQGTNRRASSEQRLRPSAVPRIKHNFHVSLPRLSASVTCGELVL